LNLIPIFTAGTYPKKGFGLKDHYDESRTPSVLEPVPLRNLTMSLDYWQNPHSVHLIAILSAQLRLSAMASVRDASLAEQ